jgi:HSP20 family molecular chaperone IbpA
VNEGKASARYADGVLELVLPKKSADGGKRIAVE